MTDANQEAIDPKTTPTPNEIDPSKASESHNLFIAGAVLQRRSHIKGTYKLRYLALNLTDGGSLSCYNFPPKKSTQIARTLNELVPAQFRSKPYTELFLSAKSPESSSSLESSLSLVQNCSHLCDGMQPRWVLPPSVPWKLRDIENDELMFQITVPHDAAKCLDLDDSVEGGDDDENDDDIVTMASVNPTETATNLEKDLCYFSKKKRHRKLVFKVTVNGNEKYLWLRAAKDIGKLSDVPAISKSAAYEKTVRNVTSNALLMARVRSEVTNTLSRIARISDQEQLLSHVVFHPRSGLIKDDSHYNDTVVNQSLVTGRALSSKVEHRVVPSYCYKHRLMTRQEMHEEVMAPSETFHDLRIENFDPEQQQCNNDDFIGTLRVEVLRCLGLPKMDKFSLTDAVCYLVCGPYAFATDVIPDKLNPEWPRRSRRACIFPLSHAFAKLFVGVFDDDGMGGTDDFIGRVVLDVARLRPGSTYDVTIPLRMFRDNYTRKRRGAVQLRLRLDWGNERAALLSYLKCPIPKKKDGKPVPTVTIACSDLKAFRNVALTCQGKHLPGKYNKKIERGIKREFKLYKTIVMKIMVKKIIKDIFTYTNPPISLLVFSAWMHCVEANSFYLVPPYILLGMILLLTYNYTQIVLNPECHNGFQPLTIWEMLQALFWGGSGDRKYMNPLDNGRKVTISRLPSDITLTSQEKTERQNDSLGFSSNLDHMEFPFSDKDRYPKMTVKQSMVKTKTKKFKVKKISKEKTHRGSKKKEDESDDGDKESEMDEIAGIDDDSEEIIVSSSSKKSWTKSSVSMFKSMKKKHDYDEDDDGDEYINEDDDRDEDEEDDDEDSLVPKKKSISEVLRSKRVSVFPKSIRKSKASAHVSVEASANVVDEGESYIEEDSSYNGIVTEQKDIESKVYWKFPPNGRPLPEQDSSIYVKASIPFSKELFMIKENMQNMSLRLFDDRIYYVDGETDVTESSKEAAENELIELLGINNYPNPVTKKIALYLTPMLEMMRIGLNVFRVIFNMFMWRDPYLSFWALLSFSVLLPIFLLFPWRYFFLLCGIVLVGPQNWMLFIKIDEKEGSVTDSSEQLPIKVSDEVCNDLVMDDSSEVRENDMDIQGMPMDSNCSATLPETVDSNHSIVVTRESSSDDDKQSASLAENEGTSLEDKDNSPTIDNPIESQSPNKNLLQRCTPPKFVFQNHVFTDNGGTDEKAKLRKRIGKKTRAIKNIPILPKYKKSTTEVRQVIVPYYSPFLDSRFYDWPPERLDKQAPQ